MLIVIKYPLLTNFWLRIDFRCVFILINKFQNYSKTLEELKVENKALKKENKVLKNKLSY